MTDVAITHDEAEVIEFIPLTQLTMSDLNMRLDTPDPDADKLLKASLRSDGVLQNLLAHKAGKKYSVAGGQRRLRLLKELAKEKHIDAEYEVPVRIVPKDQALAMSLAENTTRKEIHPADEFESYSKMVNSGTTHKSIALRFGVSEKYVSQRLALGKVHKTILAAYRDEKIDLDDLQAFTIEPDTKKQLKVFKGIPHWQMHPHSIRSALRSEGMTETDKYVKFIGMEAYTEAGGTVSADLFGTDSILNDGALVMKLAEAKLQTQIEKHEKLGFKWVSIDPNVNRWEYNQVSGKIPKADRGKYGVLIHVGHSGELDIQKGLTKSRTSSTKAADGTATPRRRYSQALADDLGKMRRTILQAHLMANSKEENVIRYLHFALVDKVFGPGGRWDTGVVDLTPGSGEELNAYSGYSAPQVCQDAIAHIPMCQDKSVEQRWDAYRDLSSQHQHQLIVAATAAVVTVGTYLKKHDVLANTWIKAQAVDFQNDIRLTKENFFGRISKAQLLEIAGGHLDKARIKDLGTLKKGALADFMHALFNTQASWEAEKLKERPTYLPYGFTKEI